MSNDNFAAVRERVDPVALVEGLTQARVKHRSPGDVRLAPCPFCDSKTGFSVNPQTKTYFCHHAGCEAQGDVFTFVMQVKGFSRKWDALKFLAERVGHELPKGRPLADDRLSAVLKLAAEVKRAAADYYAGRLWACRDEEFTFRRDGTERKATVLGYQTEVRGHSEDVLRKMRVGWADGGLLAHLKGLYRDHPDRELAFAAFIASGLVRRGPAGFHDFFRPGGYVYPVVENGRVITITAKYPDEGTSPYQLPRAVELNGREVPAWGAPFFFLNHDALGAENLVLVEGENDLLSVLDLAGHEAVSGLRGTPKREQLDALAERRKGKVTYLCFDADDAGIDTTWNVAEALAGPEHDARVIAWEPREGVKDIDDLLRAVGREAAGPLFTKLVAEAAPALEFLAARLEGEMPEAEKAEAAGRFARIVGKLPLVSQDRWEKRMRKALGASARIVRKIVAEAAKPADEPSAWQPSTPSRPTLPTGIRGLAYRWGAQGLEKVELQESEGKTLERSAVVSDFIIRVERVSEVIDDLREQKELDCRLLLKGDGLDSPGIPLRLDAGRFGSNAGLAEAIASAGHVDLGYMTPDMDFIRLASGKFSRDRGISHVRTVRYVGYATSPDGDELGYVTPSVVVRNGEILPASRALAEGGLRCDLPAEGFKSVRRLDLTDIPKERCDEVLRHVLADLMGFKGPEIGRVFLGHTFLAPVFGWLSGFKPYVLALVGNSGLGKSTLAAYFQAFFGPKFTDLDLESWSGTPKAVELAGHTYKDALFVVDDFKLGHFSQPALRDAMRVLQGYADGAGRNRLSRSSNMMPSFHIRGMLAITGEDLPEGETSNLARIVPLRAPQQNLTPDLIETKRRCDETRPLYAGVMARYIAWTQRKGAAYVRERAAELLRTFVADAAIERVMADNKARVLQNLALNLLGFVLFSEFAGESEVLAEADASRMVQEHYEFLRSLFHEHVAVVTEERPFILFLRHLKAMVESEVVRLAKVSPKSGGGLQVDPEHRGGRSPLVGYRDEQHVYLLHDAVFKELGEYRARGRVSAGEFSKREIMKQLLEEGIIVPNPTRSGTNDVKKHVVYVDGDPKRVVKVPLAKLNCC